MKRIQKIAVVGLGYVGLPLALLAEIKGFDVIGIDLNQDRIKKLSAGESPINEPLTVEQIKNSKITFTTNFDDVKSVDAVIVCVPTPVDDNKTPDLGPVIGAVKSTVSLMQKGSLLVIESTINPGVCDEVIIPLIESESNHKVGETIHVAHCPERINPGDPKWNVSNINRVLGSNSEFGLNLAYDFYSTLVDAEIKKMGNIKEAEAVKVVENSFRDINIAFVNELAMSFEKLGINTNNVIDGAATKPFAFMAHYPGIGVGGHCIPVDPYYLIEYARGKGFDHQFLKLARNINENMPKYTVELLEKRLAAKNQKSLQDTNVAVLGLSYKANVADDRESPSYPVIDILKSKGANVTTFDPLITSKSSVASIDEALKSQTVAIFMTSHNQFKSIDPKQLADLDSIVDGPGLFSEVAKQLEDSGVTYIGIGN